METRLCELCNSHATLYCTSDSAFLCSLCDAKVHTDNFLVARHLRQPLCSQCKRFSGHLFSGAEIRNLRPLCRSCSGVEQLSSDDDSASSSSACVSSSESITKAPTRNNRPKNHAPSFKSGVTEVDPAIKIRAKLKRSVRVGLEWKARDVFENWSKKMELENREGIVSVAAEAVELCMGRLAFRVLVAAAFWLGLRHSGEATLQKLRRLEEISGVTAKVIVMVERKLWGRSHGRQHLKEGWAECSV